MFIEILFKILLFKGGVLIYAEHYIYVCVLFVPCFELRELGKLCCMFFFYVFYFG